MHERMACERCSRFQGGGLQPSLLGLRRLLLIQCPPETVANVLQTLFGLIFADGAPYNNSFFKCVCFLLALSFADCFEIFHWCALQCICIPWLPLNIIAELRPACPDGNLLMLLFGGTGRGAASTS